MQFFIVAIAALITSGLTLFSGFGLGTLLVPVFIIFFPVEVAISLVAIVHFLNNLFKLSLFGKHADRPVVLRFGLPAIVAALVGARILVLLSGLEPLATYQLFGQDFQLTPVKLVIAFLMAFFALFEVVPSLEKISFDAKYLSLGGIISGFFGGLSGHQGALRSAFLIRYGLSKESFIATGVVIAVLVDISRITVYFSALPRADFVENGPILLTAVIAAFFGVFIGSRLVEKITIRTIKVIVSIMLFGIAIALGLGII
ncbi:MAG: sulfite exporter TauE/SafE family protein [Actinomycetota bacterium]|nr:sulfite exporter TauE/SafE family protein [Actinomycetota bacterium]